MTEGRIVAVSRELYPEIQRGSGVVDDTRPCHFAGHDRPADAELAATPEGLRHTCGTYVIDLSGAEIETSSRSCSDWPTISKLDDSNTGLQLLSADSMTRPGWVVPNIVAAADVPIQRQRPDDFTALSDPGRW